MKYLCNVPGVHDTACRDAQFRCIKCMNETRRSDGRQEYIAGEPRQADYPDSFTVDELKARNYVGIYFPE